MIRRNLAGGLASLALGLVLTACGDGDTMAPLDVRFGETTFVVLANPIVNDDNGVTVPEPGTSRSGVEVSVGASVQLTDADGVAVLAPVEPGDKAMSLSDGTVSGEVTVSIADQELREVAIALDGNGAAVMANNDYAFDGQVVEITPSTPLSEVNAALSMSSVIVFFRGGTYTGDLEFSGSRVTLFGEGESGGEVTLNGNVTIDGSSNRIRGVRVTGDLSVPGSNAGISFSRVDGAFTLEGSGAVLLNNAFCGSANVAGSNPILLGNAGLPPIAASAGGC